MDVMCSKCCTVIRSICLGGAFPRLPTTPPEGPSSEVFYTTLSYRTCRCSTFHQIPPSAMIIDNLATENPNRMGNTLHF